MENRKYIVTGSAGFIGFHLTKSLLEAGFSVTGIDNFDAYYSLKLKVKRQEILRSYPNFSFLDFNLIEENKLDEAVKLIGPHTIFHLAAQAGVRLSLSEYGKYVQSNLIGFANVARVAKKYLVPNFLYASSSSVYGNKEKESFSESDTNITPVSFYGATKLSNEIMASALFSEGETRARGLRFFTVYGESGRPDMAYFRILDSLLNKNEFPIFGDGNDLRDFTYISDVITSILLLEKDLERRHRGFCDVVNIGGGDPRSLNEMIQILENLTGCKLLRLQEKKMRVDVNRTSANEVYLNKLIGYSPKIRLEEGLEKFFDWSIENQEIFREL